MRFRPESERYSNRNLKKIEEDGIVKELSGERNNILLGSAKPFIQGFTLRDFTA